MHEEVESVAGWLRNRSTKVLKWEETKALFVERDALRKPLWMALLRHEPLRTLFVKTMIEDPAQELLDLAKQAPAPKRDRVLATAILSHPQGKLASMVLEYRGSARKGPSRIPVEQCWAKIQEIESRLAASNIGLCVRQACKWHVPAMTTADLIQETYFGVHRAITLFDVSKGFRFSTYSGNWISHALRRVAHNSGQIRVPVHMQALASKIRKVDTGRQSYVELAAKLDVPLWKVEYVRNLARLVPVSMDVPLGDENSLTLHEVLGAKGPDVTVDLDRERELRQLLSCLRNLPPRTQRVLELRSQGDTLADIGVQLGLSRERIRQIETDGTKKLRDALSGTGPPGSASNHVVERHILDQMRGGGEHSPKSLSRSAFVGTASDFSKAMNRLRRRGTIQRIRHGVYVANGSEPQPTDQVA